jgi:hypothetical protein
VDRQCRAAIGGVGVRSFSRRGEGRALVLLRGSGSGKGSIPVALGPCFRRGAVGVRPGRRLSARPGGVACWFEALGVARWTPEQVRGDEGGGVVALGPCFRWGAVGVRLGASGWSAGGGRCRPGGEGWRAGSRALGVAWWTPEQVRGDDGRGEGLVALGPWPLLSRGSGRRSTGASGVARRRGVGRLRERRLGARRSRPTQPVASLPAGCALDPGAEVLAQRHEGQGEGVFRRSGFFLPVPPRPLRRAAVERGATGGVF